jgi:hypothetical protein
LVEGNRGGIQFGSREGWLLTHGGQREMAIRYAVGLSILTPLACIIHESRVKNPETTTRYKLQRLDLNNSLFCLSVTGLSGEKIMVKKAEKRGQKTL